MISLMVLISCDNSLSHRDKNRPTGRKIGQRQFCFLKGKCGKRRNKRWSLWRCRESKAAARPAWQQTLAGFYLSLAFWQSPWLKRSSPHGVLFVFKGHPSQSAGGVERVEMSLKDGDIKCLRLHDCIFVCPHLDAFISIHVRFCTAFAEPPFFRSPRMLISSGNINSPWWPPSIFITVLRLSFFYFFISLCLPSPRHYESIFSSHRCLFFIFPEGSPFSADSYFLSPNYSKIKDVFFFL